MTRFQPKIVRTVGPIKKVQTGSQPLPSLNFLGLVWRLILALLIDAIIFSLQLSMIDETIDNLGLEVDRILEEVVILSWVFRAVPDLTSRELLAGTISMLLVGSGIAAWSIVMNEFRLLSGSIAERFLAGFIGLCFIVSVATEFVLIDTRVKLAMGGIFTNAASLNAGTAFFLSIVFVVAANAAACVTAYLIHAIRTRKEG